MTTKNKTREGLAADAGKNKEKPYGKNNDKLAFCQVFSLAWQPWLEMVPAALVVAFMGAIR